MDPGNQMNALELKTQTIMQITEKNIIYVYHLLTTGPLL